MRFSMAMLGTVFFLLAGGQIFGEPNSYESRFDEICALVETSFWDPKGIEEVFKKEKPSSREKLSLLKGDEDFDAHVNALLGTLKTSHTNYFSKFSHEYYLYAGVFQGMPGVKKAFGDNPIGYSSIGILSRKIEANSFIFSVLEGSPAQKAGLQVGDEILLADGKPFSPVLSFEGKAGKPVSLDIRREAGGPTIQKTVVPEMVNPKEEFMKAQKASRKVIPFQGKKIAYVHVWSYAGQEFHDEFLESLASEEFSQADALIWDLRDGLGGASPDYLNVFNRNVPVIEFIGRDGKKNISDSQWRKPVVMLINNRVRSGKEILAYGMKKFKLGTLIGERTAGAVIAGRLFVLSDNSFLFLAVSGGNVDGEVLEGVGVTPDIEVPRPIPYSKGDDPQLARALKYLAQ